MGPKSENQNSACILVKVFVLCIFKKNRLLARKLTEEIDFEKKIGIFFLRLGIPPKWKKVKKILVYHFEREYANAHFKTIQGSFECKIEVWQHLEVRNAKK